MKNNEFYLHTLTEEEICDYQVKKKGVTEYVLILYLKIKRGRHIYIYICLYT